MTIEGLLHSTAFILDLIVFGTYVIGVSAVAFGFYDRFHLKWTGDLLVMIATLLSCSAILSFCEYLKHGHLYSNAMLFTYIFLASSIYFATQLKNPKLAHEKRKQKSLKDFYWEKIARG
jgi:hypothetical protein